MKSQQTPTAFTFSTPVHPRQRRDATINLSNRPTTIRTASKIPIATLDTSSTPTASSSKVSSRIFDITQLSIENSAIREGIKSISVGKYGEKPIPYNLIPLINSELAVIENTPSEHIPIEVEFLRASFLGALFMKQSISTEEFKILVNATILPRTISYESGRSRLPDTYNVNNNNNNSNGVQSVTAGHVIATIGLSNDLTINTNLSKYAFKLLCGEYLDANEAEHFGNVLYANEELSPMKALIAHVMRVRHETVDEISGLSKSISLSTSKNVFNQFNRDNKYILISEPFDGVITYDLLTPIIVKYLNEKFNNEYTIILSCGESSGPKYGPNILSIYSLLKKLNICNDDLGIIADQSIINKGISKWVEMRRIILKRPVLATCEKYADPCPNGVSEVFISSAFHPSYVEKMSFAAEHIGYSKYIIVSKGTEGCIGLHGIIGKESRILVGCKLNGNNQYKRQEFKFKYDQSTQNDDEQIEVEKVEKGSCTDEKNVEKIKNYLESGSSGSALFDSRVDATCKMLDEAFHMIQNMIDTEGIK